MLVTVGELVGVFARVFTGVLAENIGYLTTFALVGAVRATFLAFMSLSTSLLAAWISYLGIRAIVAAPPRNALISRLAPPSLYGVAFATIGIAIDIGSIIGPALSGYIIENYGFGPAFFFLSLVYIVFSASLALQRKNLEKAV